MGDRRAAVPGRREQFQGDGFSQGPARQSDLVVVGGFQVHLDDFA
ncbi:hypothetical protein [Actinophytocola glycyrrhizae]|uniref:Uncharacterized protein n=1 Tax=Actinophytocola glycyrrhizae TaxID=2044873 RepID=A0ABV9S2W0_9PSEU